MGFAFSERCIWDGNGTGWNTTLFCYDWDIQNKETAGPFVAVAVAARQTATMQFLSLRRQINTMFHTCIDVPLQHLYCMVTSRPMLPICC